MWSIILIFSSILAKNNFSSDNCLILHFWKYCVSIYFTPFYILKKYLRSLIGSSLLYCVTLQHCYSVGLPMPCSESRPTILYTEDCLAWRDEPGRLVHRQFRDVWKSLNNFGRVFWLLSADFNTWETLNQCHPHSVELGYSLNPGSCPLSV